MTLPRPTTDHQRAAIKGLVRRQVKACGGQESAATITRVGPKTLSDYGNAHTEKYRDIQMPVDVLMDLTLDGGPVALIGLCRIAGGAFVPLPDASADAASDGPNATDGDGAEWGALSVGKGYVSRARGGALARGSSSRRLTMSGGAGTASAPRTKTSLLYVSEMRPPDGMCRMHWWTQ